MNELDRTRELYEAAIAFRDLRPWEWMYDSDLFGVEDPMTGEIGYCCIMGNAGQVFGLGVYLGEEGFKTYLAMANMPDDLPFCDTAAIALDQRMLMVEFVDRKELQEPDLAQIKALGMKFRGRRQWPKLRDYRPGFVPWFLNPDQTRFLTLALQQAVDVATRCKDDEAILGDEERGMLIRTASRKNGDGQWTDRYQPSKELTVQFFPSKDPLSARVKKAQKELPWKSTTLLYLLQYNRTAVEEKDQYDRPHIPKIAVWIDDASGMILGFDLISPKQAMEQIEAAFFNQLHQLGFIPRQIGVGSVMALAALIPIAEALQIKMALIPDEPAFQEVQESLGMG